MGLPSLIPALINHALLFTVVGNWSNTTAEPPPTTHPHLPPRMQPHCHHHHCCHLRPYSLRPKATMLLKILLMTNAGVMEGGCNPSITALVYFCGNWTSAFFSERPIFTNEFFTSAPCPSTRYHKSQILTEIIPPHVQHRNYGNFCLFVCFDKNCNYCFCTKAVKRWNTKNVKF